MALRRQETPHAVAALLFLPCGLGARKWWVPISSVRLEIGEDRNSCREPHTYVCLGFSGFVLIREGGFGFRFFYEISMLPTWVRVSCARGGFELCILGQLSQFLLAQHVFQPLALRLNAVVLLRHESA